MASTNKPTGSYPVISASTYFWFAVFMIAIIALYTHKKLRPIAILLVVVVLVGLWLRFSPQVMNQASQSKSIITGGKQNG